MRRAAQCSEKKLDKATSRPQNADENKSSHKTNSRRRTQVDLECPMSKS